MNIKIISGKCNDVNFFTKILGSLFYKNVHLYIYRNAIVNHNNKEVCFMKLVAKVKFKDREETKNLIRTFFKKFKKDSKISIENEEAYIEILFDEPPTEIIEIILKGEEIYFKCEEENTEMTRRETVEEGTEQTKQETAEEDTEQIEQETAEEDTEQTEPETAEKVTEQTERGTKRIPELEEIKKNCSSYEEFAHAVSIWLEMDKRQDFFENLILSAKGLKKVRWENIENDLKAKGIKYEEWDKIWCSQRVSKKFQGRVTIMKFIKEIIQYDFSSFQKVTTIPHIDEILSGVDKTQPIEERVKEVLVKMGWNDEDDNEQNVILEIADKAMQLSEMSLEKIFEKTNIPEEMQMYARMTFSEFINNYIKKYDSNKVKVLDFLKDMQRCIIFESEINE